MARLAVVGELKRLAVVLISQERDNLLKGIFGSGAHAQLIGLDNDLALELERLDILVDLLGGILVDAVDDAAEDAHRAARGSDGSVPAYRLDVDAALDQLGIEDISDLSSNEISRRRNGNRPLGLGERDLRSGILEIVALRLGGR